MTTKGMRVPSGYINTWLIHLSLKEKGNKLLLQRAREQIFFRLCGPRLQLLNLTIVNSMKVATDTHASMSESGVPIDFFTNIGDWWYSDCRLQFADYWILVINNGLGSTWTEVSSDMLL